MGNDSLLAQVKAQFSLCKEITEALYDMNRKPMMPHRARELQTAIEFMQRNTSMLHSIVELLTPIPTNIFGVGSDSPSTNQCNQGFTDTPNKLYKERE